MIVEHQIYHSTFYHVAVVMFSGQGSKFSYVFSRTQQIQTTSTVADARHQEENPKRKKCLKAIVQEGHNICSREWQMLSVYRQIKILV